jgi:hypothetical protein
MKPAPARFMFRLPAREAAILDMLADDSRMRIESEGRSRATGIGRARIGKS